MRKNVDYNLLIESERVRYQSDYSTAHWLHQIISQYERGIQNKLRREAFEKVLRCAINSGCKNAIKLASTFPPIAGFPNYLKLESECNWKETSQYILNNFKQHEFNRFRYVRDGD